MNQKWASWVTFGSVLMMIVGAFKLIAGVIGLFRDQWLVLGYNGYRLVDITGLAIWYICIGAILFLGGIAALQGSRLGRVVGAVAAALAAISEFFMIPYYPIWSIIMLVLYVIVLWAFIAWKGLTPYEEQELPVAEAAPAFVAAAGDRPRGCWWPPRSSSLRRLRRNRRWSRRRLMESRRRGAYRETDLRPRRDRGRRPRLRGEARCPRSQDHRRPARCRRQPERPGGPGGGHGHQRQADPPLGQHGRLLPGQGHRRGVLRPARGRGGGHGPRTGPAAGG